MSGMAEWCPWCNVVLRGKLSNKYGLCSKCRRTKEGQEKIICDQMGDMADFEDSLNTSNKSEDRK